MLWDKCRKCMSCLLHFYWFSDLLYRVLVQNSLNHTHFVLVHFKTDMSSHSTEHYCMWEWMICCSWVSVNSQKRDRDRNRNRNRNFLTVRYVSLSSLLCGQSNVATSHRAAELFGVLSTQENSLERGTEQVHTRPPWGLFAALFACYCEHLWTTSSAFTSKWSLAFSYVLFLLCFILVK